VWKGEKVSPTEVRYSYGAPTEPLEIVKDFTIAPRTASCGHRLQSKGYDATAAGGAGIAVLQSDRA
jgi:hypothetical protein